ncbi:MAG: elongation factor P [Candidatus Neomarinimicrobiota bacterium]|nr:elongation factor P [Candidatus Neomarinimicrobiota bacterium]MDX9779655.1 elongation factor P [bacterium]
MASTADFRTGMVIVYDNELYKIVSYQHSKMGRAGAVVRTKMKNLLNGRVLENTFRSGEKVEEARVEANFYQFLYRDGNMYYMMDPETYEQIPVEESVIGDDFNYIRENDEVKVLMYQERPIAIELPAAVELKVTYTEPGERGDTAKTNVKKPATLETGMEVQVPLFINEGDIIKIDTRDGSYLERVNK